MELYKKGKDISNSIEEIPTTERYSIPIKIKEDVIKWLKETNEIKIEFHTKNYNSCLILFFRSIIHIKTCANTYDEWIIATSSYFDEIISIPGKHYQINDYNDIVVNNEILTLNYSHDKYIPLGYKIEDKKITERKRKLKKLK